MGTRIELTKTPFAQSFASKLYTLLSDPLKYAGFRTEKLKAFLESSRDITELPENFPDSEIGLDRKSSHRDCVNFVPLYRAYSMFLAKTSYICSSCSSGTYW